MRMTISKRTAGVLTTISLIFCLISSFVMVDLGFLVGIQYGKVAGLIFGGSGLLIYFSGFFLISEYFKNLEHKCKITPKTERS